MNRKQLLSLAKSKGYQGKDDDLAAIKSFLKDNSIELVDATGKSVDVDTIWTKTVKIVVTAEGEDVSLNGTALEPAAAPGADAGTTDSADGPPPAGKSARQLLEDDRRAASGQTASFKRAQSGIAAPAVHVNWEKSAYDRKVKSGKAVFGSSDEAAQFGAFTRLAVFETKGVKDYAQKKSDLEIVGKAGSTVVNTTGGVLVPEQFASVILDLAENYGVARRVANVIPMARDTYVGPRITTDFSFSHTAENAQASATDPGLDQVMLTAKKVMYLGYISNELLEDSAFNVGDVYAQIGARAYAYRQDLDYVLGDGTSTYGGNSGLASALPSGSYVAQLSGSTWAAQTTGDFDVAIGRLENVPGGARVGIICSRQYYYQVLRRLDHATSQFRELSDQAREFNADGMFLGLPVYFSQVCPTATATTQKCCYIGAFAAASMLGQRREMTMATSDQFRWDYDQTAIRMTARYAVNVHGDGRGSTYGPITCIKTS